MTWLDVAGFAASVSIVVTYAMWALYAKPGRWMNVANALGGPVLLAGEIAAHAWFIMPITVTFTVVGWAAVLTGEDD